MINIADIDPNEIDPDSVERFKQYGSPDPENIDHQLLREYRKSHIKNVGADVSFADVFLAIVLDLVAIPLAYASVMVVVNLGWWGLIVPAIFFPALASAIVYTAGLFQR